MYVNSKLKLCFSVKKRYTMSSVGLVGHNKRLLYGAVGAPSNTNDAGVLKSTNLQSQVR